MDTPTVKVDYARDRCYVCGRTKGDLMGLADAIRDSIRARKDPSMNDRISLPYAQQLIDSYPDISPVSLPGRVSEGGSEASEICRLDIQVQLCGVCRKIMQRASG